MLRIGICDENAENRESVRKILTKVLFYNEEFSCMEYADAETLEQELERETVPFNLLLLEITFQSKNGLQLAKKIRQKKLDVDIIFVTEETKYVYEGYDVQAIGYILKKNMSVDLPVCLQRYMAGYRQGKMLTIKSELAYRTVLLADIQYIESNGRRLLIHTDREEIPFYGKLADIEEQIGTYGFLRIHQSFLVRKSKIAGLQGYEVSVGERWLPVSRRYYRKVQELFCPESGNLFQRQDADQTVTRSVALHMDDNGAVIGTKGELLGVIYRMKKGEHLYLGRDLSICQIGMTKSTVSRKHCVIRRLENGNYEIEDCSKNGVYVEGTRIGKGNKKEAYAGNRVWICDASQELRLG